MSEEKFNWITLNVGGKTFSTTKKTLEKSPDDSILKEMLKSDFQTDGVIKKEKEFVYLIDRSPKYFEHVLNFLRYKKMFIKEFDIKEGIIEEAEYYNLKELVQFIEDNPFAKQDLDRKQIISLILSTEEGTPLKIKGICLAGNNLSRLEFKLAQFDLSDLRLCKLEMTEFYECSFRKSLMDKTNSRNCIFKNTNFNAASMKEIQFKNSLFELSVFNTNDFIKTDMSDCQFIKTNFENGKFIDSDLQKTSFKDCTIKNFTFEKINFSKAKFIQFKFESCNFVECQFFEIEFKDSVMNSCTFESCEYDKSTFELTEFLSTKIDFEYLLKKECAFNSCVITDIDLSEKSFKKCNLNGCKFLNCLFDETDFEGSSFENAEFQSCSLKSANLEQCNLNQSKFIKSDLTKTIFQLEGCNSTFYSSNLSGFDWTNCKVESIDFTSSNLTDIIFTDGTFKNCQFQQVSFTNSEFTNADFTGSNFKQASYKLEDLRKSASVKFCDFEGSDWSSSDLKKWDLSGANLKNVILSNSELSGIKLTDAILEGADMTTSIYELEDLLQANLKDTKLKGEISISAGFGGFKGELVIWELNSNNKKDIAGKNKFSKVQSLKFAGNSGFTGTEEGKILNWSLATSSVEYTLEGRGSVDCLDFDDSVLINGRKNEVEIWDFKNQNLKHTLIGHSKGVNCVQLVDKKIVSGSFDSLIKIWDIETSKLLSDIDGHLSFGSVNDIQYDSIKNILVSSGSGKHMFIWDMKTTKLIRKLDLDKKVSAVNCMKLLDDNIFWNTRDPVVHVWDIRNLDSVQKNELKGNKKRLTSLCPTKNGNLFAGTDDGCVLVWSLKTNQISHKLNDHSGSVRCVQIIS
eukprot:gene5601-9418_t